MEQENNYTDVVETLWNMFGDVVSREVIMAVVEYCSGDLESAAEAVITIASNEDSEMVNTNTNIINEGINMIKNSTDVMTNSASMTSEITNNSYIPPDNNIVTVPAMSSQTILPNDIQKANSTSSIPLHPVSYALTTSSCQTGAVPKQVTKPVHNPYDNQRLNWSDEIRSILKNHNEGNRILIFMRGPSGSGKTYLSRKIIDMCMTASEYLYSCHIFSTDDFFLYKGVYQYEKHRLCEAHDWNQKRVDFAIRQGLSPIIVDNTNIELWEMDPYLRTGVNNGYIVEIVEPNNSWSKNANQLMRKTTHNVPLQTIRRHLDNFVSCCNGWDLIKKFGLSYPTNMVPTVKRNLPQLEPPISSTSATEITSKRVISKVTLTEPKEKNQPISPKSFVSHEASMMNIVKENNEQILTPNVEGLSIETESIEIKEAESKETESKEAESKETESKEAERKETESKEAESKETDQDGEEKKQQRYLEIEKQFEDILKVEEEWENGETWDEISQTTVKDEIATNIPKPPRSGLHESKPCEDFLSTVKNCQDWSKISILMPTWSDTKSDENNAEILTISMKHAGTSIENGDTDLQYPKLNCKVLSASPRNINMFYIPPERERIPQNRMLDASTMTNDFLVTGAYRCNNEEQHFVSLRKMFRNIPKADLRDIFDNCCGDVNWAVEIILDGMASHQLATVDDPPDSDTEENVVELCNCLSAYNIVPSVSPAVTNPVTNQVIPDYTVETDSVALAVQKKLKLLPSESSVQLKRQIEKNVVIADNHYSEHCLKLRKLRRGELDNYMANENWDLNDPKPMSSTAQALPVIEGINLGTNPGFGLALDDKENSKNDEGLESEIVADGDSDDDSSFAGSFDEPEATTNITLGWDLIKKLDSMFGRDSITYPENVVPNINIPVTLLNEINAFWIESLMNQMDEQDKLKTRLLKEDEEFARQIQMQEAELALQGKEPEVPDFKEIMDMDLAISLYQKDVAGWRDSEPKDLAARMTREKLYNLFPDLSNDVLAELLMAHDNNFKATVESLLMSTGKASVLNTKNGLNKFVMEKELARQQKLLEEEQQALSEVEWPLLPQGEKVEMSAVDHYRKQADEHLQRRHQNHEKATDYVRRGMPQVAITYSELAHFHTRQFQQNSSLAAACLMQYHASNCPNTATVDLHFLRVAEARETLDLFIDTHIRKLQETRALNQGPRAHKLFFITGRGVHSQGGQPKVKPAIRKRLRERGLTVSESNPGLLTTRVTADDKLTYQVPA